MIEFLVAAHIWYFDDIFMYEEDRTKEVMKVLKRTNLTASNYAKEFSELPKDDQDHWIRMAEKCIPRAEEQLLLEI